MDNVIFFLKKEFLFALIIEAKFVDDPLSPDSFKNLNFPNLAR